MSTKSRADVLPRFTIVKYKGINYVLENKPKYPQLVSGEGPARLAQIIPADTELEVVMFPAQSAFELLKHLTSHQSDSLPVNL